MNKKLYKLMNWPEIEGIIYADEAHPERLLGPHIKGSQTLIQAFLPRAEAVSVLTGKPEKEYPMELADEDGFFAVLVPGKGMKEYRLKITDRESGEETICGDPYACPVPLDDEERVKWMAGTHYHTYELMGAHCTETGGEKGVLFRVWAPEAVRVSVVGEFNRFDGRIHPMCLDDETGIFSLFIPGLTEGCEYRYEIRKKGGGLLYRNDPYAASFTERDGHGLLSLVDTDRSYQWKHERPGQRTAKAPAKEKDALQEPMLIYELNLNDFFNSRKEAGKLPAELEETAGEKAKWIRKMGYTHVALTGVLAENLSVGAVHAPLSFYGVNQVLKKPENLKKLVDLLHGEGLYVIMDYAAACFAGRERGQELLGRFDGSCLYEHLDERQGYHPSFGVSLFHYGSPQVTDFLISAAVRLVEVFHADGLRFCDTSFILYLDYGKQTGEWIPNMFGGNENLEGIEFLKHSCSILKKKYPELLLVTDEFSGWRNMTSPLDQDGFGFDLKWNYAFTNELFKYLAVNPINRSRYHQDVTMSYLYRHLENFVLAFSKDYLGKCECGMDCMYGKDHAAVFNAQKKLLYAYAMVHPGKKYFMPLLPEGCDSFIEDCNQLYLKHPALYRGEDSEESFEWINSISANECVLLFLRRFGRETLLVAVNFANCTWDSHKAGVPFDGKYKEIFSTEDVKYFGSGSGNPRILKSKKDECDMREDSIRMTLPPLSVSVLEYVPYTEKELEQMRQKELEKLKKQEEARRKKERLKKEKAKIKASLKEELARKIAKAEEEIAKGSEYRK